MPETTSPGPFRTSNGYRATWEDGALVIHDVPIFCECERHHEGKTVHFDGKWIGEAVMKAKEAEVDDYLPPLHIWHHDDKNTDRKPRPAGVFRVTGMKSLRLKGRDIAAAFADLIVTHKEAQDEILARRLPYRSVEIFNVGEPSFGSLALLDDEAPYLELPMLMVSEVQGEPGCTFSMEKYTQPSTPMVACFSRGSSARLLFREDDSVDDAEKKDRDEDSVNMEAEEGGGGVDAAAVIKAIEDGSISIADFDAIKAAMASREGAAEPEPEEEEELAPAAFPGGESMSKGKPAISADAQARIDALETWKMQREQDDVRVRDVAEAMKRLDQFPNGSNLEGELVAFHKEHGPGAFKDYVEMRVKYSSELHFSADDKAESFAKQPGKASEFAMKFQKEHGIAGVEQAMQFEAQWEQLNERGITKQTKERFVELSMREMNHG